MARYDWKEPLVDLFFGEGAYNAVTSLVENPTETDEKRWRQKNSKVIPFDEILDKFGEDNIADMIRYLSDRMASWRISNGRQKIKDSQALKMRAKTQIAIVDLFNKGFGAVAIESFGRVVCIDAFKNQKLLLPPELSN